MTAARGHYVSKEFCTPEVEEEREEARRQSERRHICGRSED